MYILGHTHVESNRNISKELVKQTTLQILNSTYKLGVEIGKSARADTLFMDGFDEELVSETEKYLDEVQKYHEIAGDFLKHAMPNMLMDGHTGEFQSLWGMLLYSTLRESPLQISLKPTDIRFAAMQKELGPRLFLQWCFDNLKDPGQITTDDFRTYKTYETRFRDDHIIYENIKKGAGSCSLLVIGEAHSLDKLCADPEFETHRLDIRHVENDTYTAVGHLPKKLFDTVAKIKRSRENDLSAFLPLRNCNLNLEIEFS